MKRAAGHRTILSTHQLRVMKQTAAAWGYPSTLKGVIEYCYDMFVAKGAQPLPSDREGLTALSEQLKLPE